MPVHGSGPKTLFVPYNGKIADITHADTNQHLLDLAAALSEARKIISVLVGFDRMAGTGAILLYPNEGANSSTWMTSRMNPPMTVIKNESNRLPYSLTVANDDWDVYCFGYVVEA
jgi:hypothetical protein